MGNHGIGQKLKLQFKIIFQCWKKFRCLCWQGSAVLKVCHHRHVDFGDGIGMRAVRIRMIQAMMITFQDGAHTTIRDSTPEEAPRSNYCINLDSVHISNFWLSFNLVLQAKIFIYLPIFLVGHLIFFGEQRYHVPTHHSPYKLNYNR